MPECITGDLSNSDQDDYSRNGEVKEVLRKNDGVVLLDHHEDYEVVRDPKNNKGIYGIQIFVVWVLFFMIIAYCFR